MTTRIFLLLFLLFINTTHGEAASKNGFDLADSLLPASDILSGGPPRDGIPAINNPIFESAESANWLKDDDRILGVEIQGEARAYPIRILDWHEIVNDRFGNAYFTVTYCPLCGTGMVFSAKVGDANLRFGVSGLLYNSDVLLYDRDTESLWSQILSQAISGPLQGTVLEQLPASHTSWKKWRSMHPQTRVLSRDTGFDRDYDVGPYGNYEKSNHLMFRVSHAAPGNYHPKERVLGLELEDVFKAYPFKELSQQGLARFTDRVGQSTIVIEWDEDAQSAGAFDEAGNALVSTTAFWFAWYAFHAETEVFKASRR